MMAEECAAVASIARKSRSANSCANSDNSPRCCSLACSGTSSTKSNDTGLPSGASKGTGSDSRTNPPRTSFSPFMRPWGIAIPCPKAVEPSRSRASNDATIRARSIPQDFSNMAPISSMTACLLTALISSKIRSGHSSLQTMLAAGKVATSRLPLSANETGIFTVSSNQHEGLSCGRPDAPMHGAPAIHSRACSSSIGHAPSFIRHPVA